MTTVAPRKGGSPEPDPLADALLDAILNAVADGDLPEGAVPLGVFPEPVTGEAHLPTAQTEIEVIDIGPYCVECREDTAGQAGRTERLQDSVKITGQQDENGDPEVVTVKLKGWLCESCQPFQSDLIEATAQALIERRMDPIEVRRKLRELGEEKIWEVWQGPMLDSIEVALELEMK
jgi:hypothetical protein